MKIFFPDPWYGSVERRIVRPDVVQQISRRMRPSGYVHVATDVHGYPDGVRAVFASAQSAGGYWRADAERRVVRPSTRYEREGIAAGRTIEDLHFAFEGVLQVDDVDAADGDADGSESGTPSSAERLSSER